MSDLLLSNCFSGDLLGAEAAEVSPACMRVLRRVEQSPQTALQLREPAAKDQDWDVSSPHILETLRLEDLAETREVSDAGPVVQQLTWEQSHTPDTISLLTARHGASESAVHDERLQGEAGTSTLQRTLIERRQRMQARSCTPAHQPQQRSTAQVQAECSECCDKMHKLHGELIQVLQDEKQLERQSNQHARFLQQALAQQRARRAKFKEQPSSTEEPGIAAAFEHLLTGYTPSTAGPGVAPSAAAQDVTCGTEASKPDATAVYDFLSENQLHLLTRTQK